MPRQPKILMFGWEFPPHNSGGLGVACEGLSRALAENNTAITFVLPKKVKLSPSWLKMLFGDSASSVRIVDSLLTPYITSEGYAIRRTGIAKSIYGWGLFDEVKRYALQAAVIAEDESFDVIHAHDWLSFPAGIAAKEVSGKPLVVHVHATEFDRGGGRVNETVYQIEQEGMKKADKVVAVSEFTKKYIVEQYGIAPEKVAVVHNGINLASYPERAHAAPLLRLKEKGAKIVLFAGRLTLQKGPDYFLAATKRVLEYAPNTYFVIAGSGDMEGRLIRDAVSLGVSDRVLFAGFARGEELNDLYRQADLFVLPSVSEPFGITPLEAIAHGTPVIISKNAGVGEVLSHALRVDFWDIDEMANKIVGVLEHKSLHDELHRNSRREIEGITWKKAAEKCLGIYKELVQKFAFGA